MAARRLTPSLDASTNRFPEQPIHSQLNHIIAQQRRVALQRVGARARQAHDVQARRRSPRHSRRIALLSARLAALTGWFPPASL